MKIVQLIYSLCSGGAERFVVSLSNELADMGHDVTVCMLLSEENDEYVFNRQYLSCDVKFVSLKFDNGFTINKIKRVEKFLLAVQPDVVHCHLNVIPYIFRIAYKHRQIKFIHTLHNIAENASGPRFQKVINRYFYKKNLIVPVTISKLCGESYENYYGLSNPIVIDNGCEILNPTDEYDTVCREVDSYKKDNETIVCIHVARFHPQKNQNMLIDVFNHLYREGQNISLLIIGDGFSTGEGAYLKSRACEAIHFLGLKNNVADYLMCSDIFCLTSLYEGLPISLLEAMSMGVVPICTSVGGIPDVIENGKTGILSEVNLPAYVNAFRQYFELSISREDIHDAFMTRFSIRSCAEKYIEVYK